MYIWPWPTLNVSLVSSSFTPESITVCGKQSPEHASVAKHTTTTQTAILVGLARTVYMYTVYDCILGDFPAKYNIHTPYVYVYMVLANPSHHL